MRPGDSDMNGKVVSMRLTLNMYLSDLIHLTHDNDAVAVSQTRHPRLYVIQVNCMCSGSKKHHGHA